MQFLQSRSSRIRFRVCTALGLVAVAFGLILLPVFYFGLVGAIVWLVYWHIHNLDWYMAHLHGLLGFTIFVAPILAGVVTVYFMSRPFFSRPEQPAEAVPITPEAEPTLFEFIRMICGLLHAPFPKRVYVNWQANASASLHRGLKSLFNRDLDLTLGLPLVAALNVGQFGGVLAHEFGHFAQGAGMRLSYVIRVMNGWLARIAYQPGDLEEKLAHSGFNQTFWGRLALETARFGLWIARWTLRGLTMLGHAISCFWLRQMEFDADLYEAKVSGPDEFAAVMKKLRFLDAGGDSAHFLLAQNLGNNRLPKDISVLTLARAEAAVDYYRRQIERAIAQESSEWFSTHPSSRERIEHVRRTRVSPIFVDHRPASELFRNFSVLSEQVTLEYYRRLGLPMDDMKLSDVEEICEGRALSPAKLAAVRNFFADRLAVDRPIILGVDELAEPLLTGSSEIRLRENFDLWQITLAETNDAFDKFHAACARTTAIERARGLKQASIRFRPSDYLLESRSSVEMERTRAAALAALSKVEPDLIRFEDVARKRLVDALRLLDVTRDGRATAIELVDALEKFRPLFALLPKLRSDFVVYATLYPLKQSQSPRRKAHKLRLELSQTLNHHLSALNPLLRDIVLPYSERESLLEQLRRRLPDEQMPFEATIYRDVSVYLEEIDIAYYRIIGDLCLLAQNAESCVMRSETG